MPRRLPETNLAQAIGWIWLGFLLAGLTGWAAYRYWRRRHPPPPPAPQRSYSQQLEARLNKGRGTGKRKRSRPSKSGPRSP